MRRISRVHGDGAVIAPAAVVFVRAVRRNSSLQQHQVAKAQRAVRGLAEDRVRARSGSRA